MKFKIITSLLFVSLSITWGCNQSSSGEKETSETEQPPQEEQVQTLEQPETPPIEVDASGEPDQYGRKPGDQHYGHDHPPQDAQQQIQTNTQQETPPSGEPDKHGRKPGEEHYGHDHP